MLLGFFEVFLSFLYVVFWLVYIQLDIIDQLALLLHQNG